MPDITNPFSPGWMPGVKLLAFALVFGWIYLRVNKQEIFLMLAGALGVNAVVTFIFYSGDHLNFIGVLLNFLVFTAVMSGVAAMVASLIYYHLPGTGLSTEYVVDEAEGKIKPAFAGAVSFLVFLVLRLVFAKWFEVAEKQLGGISFVLNLIQLGAMAFAIIQLMPIEASHDAFISSTFTIKPINILEVKGEAHPIEKALFPLMFYCIYMLIPYMLKPAPASDPAERKKQELAEIDVRSDADLIGLIIIGVVVLTFIKTTFFKDTSIFSFISKKEEPPPPPPMSVK